MTPYLNTYGTTPYLNTYGTTPYLNTVFVVTDEVSVLEIDASDG